MSDGEGKAPAVGAIRFDGDEMLTFDGKNWRSMTRVPDTGVGSAAIIRKWLPDDDVSDELGDQSPDGGPAQP